MTKINLLPDDFREKEKKELKKLAKQPKIFQIELSQSGDGKNPNLKSDKPVQSWWKKILGERSFKSRPAIASGNLKPAYSSAEPVAPNKEKVDFKQAARKSVNKNGRSWKDIFGFSGLPTIPKSLVDSSVSTVKREKSEIKMPRLRQGFGGWFGGRGKRSTLNMDNSSIFKSQKKVASIKEPATDLKPSFDNDREKSEKYRFTQGKSIQKEDKKKEGRYHEAPKSEKLKFDINLIPEELISIKYYSIRWQVFVALVAIIIPCLVIYGAYFLINQKQEEINGKIEAYNQEIGDLQQQLNNYKKKQNENIALQQKLLTLTDLLNDKIYWSNFFNLLEKYTLDGVYYQTLSADTSGDFVLPAVADDYNTMARQVVALRQAADFVDDVKVDSARLMSTSKEGVVGVMFDLKISLIDDILQPKKE